MQRPAALFLLGARPVSSGSGGIEGCLTPRDAKPTLSLWRPAPHWKRSFWVPLAARHMALDDLHLEGIWKSCRFSSVKWQYTMHLGGESYCCTYKTRVDEYPLAVVATRIFPQPSHETRDRGSRLHTQRGAVPRECLLFRSSGLVPNRMWCDTCCARKRMPCMCQHTRGTTDTPLLHRTRIRR